MEQSVKKPRIWILVADGSRARIIRYKANGEHLDDLVFEADHKQLKEIMADKPGRSFSSSGANRSAMEYHSDPVRQQADDFAAFLCERLEQGRIAGEFDSIAIVAEPRMLGTIRPRIPHLLGSMVVAEIGKDLTKVPAHELYPAIARLDIPGLSAA
jgi:protein required for attachment to host cells